MYREDKKLSDQISEEIIESFDKKRKFINSDFIYVLDNASECLEKINDVKSREQFDIIMFGNGITIPNIEHEQHIFEFYFFGTMLGFIDGNIDTCLKKITNSNKKIVDNNGVYYADKLEDLILKREEIISDYHRIGSKDEPLFGKDFDDVLTTCPCYLKFTNIYKDAGKYPLNLPQHLINAYNIGYMNKDENYKSYYVKYLYFVNDLTKCIEKNRKEVEKVKKMEK